MKGNCKRERERIKKERKDWATFLWKSWIKHYFPVGIRVKTTGDRNMLLFWSISVLWYVQHGVLFVLCSCVGVNFPPRSSDILRTHRMEQRRPNRSTDCSSGDGNTWWGEQQQQQQHCLTMAKDKYTPLLLSQLTILSISQSKIFGTFTLIVSC